MISKTASLQQIVAHVRSRVLAQLNSAAAVSVSRAQLTSEIERIVSRVADDERIPLSRASQSALVMTLVDDIAGIGPLGPLLADPNISDILVNGPDEVFIEVDGKLVRTNARFRDEDHVRFIAQRIASAIGRRVDDSSPLLDARLPDGSRVNVVLPPLAVRGPYISIRKFSKDIGDFATLISYGSLNERMAQTLICAIRARLNIVVSGGTGAGKTTLLNVMAQFIAPNERVVTIEDVAELKLPRAHAVPMETRPPNIEGAGQILARDLVRNALRMRPDRIIISECRGEETLDMLQAMNTGHRGSLTTLHANSPRDALRRIEQLVQMSSASLPAASIRSQIASAIDLVVQVERMRDGVRRVTGIHAVAEEHGDELGLLPLWEFRYVGESEDGKIISNFVSTNRPTKFDQDLEYYGELETFKSMLDPSPPPALPPALG